MPGNLNPINPIDVLPKQLAKAFTMELRMETLLNAYPDGNSERVALALNPRAYFRMTHGVTVSEWQALLNFYLSHLVTPFFFYNLRETVPPFSWDGSGANTIGRYTVVFDGQWSDIYVPGRATVSLALREVA